MKIRSLFTTLLIVPALLIAAAGTAQAAGDKLDTIKRSFRVSPGGTLEIDIDRGNVEIIASEDDQVHVEMERIVNARNEDEEKAILDLHEWEIEKDGDNVVVESRFEQDEDWTWKKFKSQSRFKLRVTVRVPERYNVDFETAAGNVDVSGLYGYLYGNTGAGNITVGEVRGDVELRSGSGNLTLNRVTGNLDASSGAGNVRVGAADGEVRVNTGAGNVIARLTSQPSGDSRFESGAGNVTVYLVEDAQVVVDAQASVGSASCEFPLTVKGKWMTKSFDGKINGGGPELTLRSGVGNVSLKKLSD